MAARDIDSKSEPSRRSFFRQSASAFAGLVMAENLLAGCVSRGEDAPVASAEDGWVTAREILRRIKPPSFPKRDFHVSDFGVDPDSESIATDGLQRAIDACHEAGGGRVVIPAGSYRTGGLRLRSNVNLHVTDGAILLFSRDPAAYLPAVFTRWEGVELFNYAPFVYALDAENVGLTGKGTLDGQAGETHWWPWKGKTEYGWNEGIPNQADARSRLFELAESGVEVPERAFGDGDYLRPNFVQTYRCRNVLIEGLTFLRSPMWVLHPVLSENVIIRGVTVESHGPNNDGCDVESCRDVLIEDCLFDTGDDCVVMKSGRNADGRRVGRPVENVIVRNCEMRDGHGGIVIGSEISGGATNIFAEDCRMDSPNLDRVLRIKTNSVRGGIINGVFLRNISATPVADAVVRVNFLYEEGDVGSYTPELSGIYLEKVTCAGSRYGLFLRGYERSPVRTIEIKNCRFDDVREGNVIEHVEGLVIENVVVNGKPLEL